VTLSEADVVDTVVADLMLSRTRSYAALLDADARGSQEQWARPPNASSKLGMGIVPPFVPGFARVLETHAGVDARAYKAEGHDAMAGGNGDGSVWLDRPIPAAMQRYAALDAALAVPLWRSMAESLGAPACRAARLATRKWIETWLSGACAGSSGAELPIELVEIVDTAVIELHADGFLGTVGRAPERQNVPPLLPATSKVTGHAHTTRVILTKAKSASATMPAAERPKGPSHSTSSVIGSKSKTSGPSPASSLSSSTQSRRRGGPDVSRFVPQVKRDIDAACRELRKGKKSSCWMWWIFPVHLSVNSGSSRSREYAIRSLDEAFAYLAHPDLGPAIVRAASAALTQAKTTTAYGLFGPDESKLRHSATLFAEAVKYDRALSLNPVDRSKHVFDDIIREFFQGSSCADTLRAIEAER
jgi:uncharacterized protein (DUF1810 family)